MSTKISEHKLQAILTDFSINIGEQAERASISLADEIQTCATQYCDPMHPHIERLVMHASKAAYFTALRTIENSIAETLRQHLIDPSD